MAVLQVREHEVLKIGQRDPARRVLSVDQAATLRRIEPTLPPGVLRWGHKQVKVTQFCGVISLGQDSIEILPKLFGYESQPGISREILVKMLYAAHELAPIRHGAANIALQRHHLLDVFISHFCSVLFAEIHKGLIKVYVDRKESLPVIKGRLLVSQQFRRNLVQQQRVYCAFDELQVDNSYNQALKATLRLLYRVARSNRLRQRLTELLYIFDDVSDMRVTAEDVRRLPRNRLVARFDGVLRLAEWFLAGASPDVVAGQSPTIALLFDMNRVFEAFIGSMLRRVVKAHGGRVVTQGPQRFLANEQASGRKLFLMKPDFSVLSAGGARVFIADSKWKLLDATDGKYGVRQADVYQMLAYGTQYECRRLVLIYPSHAQVADIAPVIEIRKGGYRIDVWGIDLAGLAGFGPSVGAQLQARVAGLLSPQSMC